MIKRMREKWLEQNLNSLNTLLEISEYDQNPFTSLQKIICINDALKMWKMNAENELENLKLELEKE